MTGAAQAFRRGRPTRQRGATLVIALLMMALMMIHAIASFTAADVQLRNAGSLQSRQDALAAADVALGRVIGASAFVTQPDVVAATPVDIDIDGDGRIDYRVTVAPSCSGSINVRSSALDPAVADDAACLAAALPGGEIPCADTTWNLKAVAIVATSAAETGVRVEVNQGVRVRLDAAEAALVCSGQSATNSLPTGPVTLSKARKKTYWYTRT